MKITKIEQQKHHKKLYSIFIDGKYSFHLHRELLVELNIHEGQKIKEKELKDIIKTQQKKEARDYAFLLLSYRDRSRKEIHIRLKRKKIEEDIIQEIIKNLEDLKYIDDYKFATTWINQRLQEKPRGKKLLRQELYLKGVDKKIIDKAIDEAFPSDSDDELALAKGALKKKLPSYKKLDKKTALRRMQNFLLRRGFSYDIIKQVSDDLF